MPDIFAATTSAAGADVANDISRVRQELDQAHRMVQSATASRAHAKFRASLNESLSAAAGAGEVTDALQLLDAAANESSQAATHARNALQAAERAWLRACAFRDAVAAERDAMLAQREAATLLRAN